MTDTLTSAWNVTGFLRVLFLLFYLNLSASVVLLGAEVNAAVYQAVSGSMKVVELPGNLDNEATNTGRLKDV